VQSELVLDLKRVLMSGPGREMHFGSAETLGLAGSLEKIAFGMHRHVSASLHSTISLAFIKEEKVALRADGNAKESIISFSVQSYT